MTAAPSITRFDDLPRAQQRALIDIVWRGGIERLARGWDGSTTYAHRTVSALAGLGLCRIRDDVADPTPRGRRLIRTRFSDAYAMVDFLRGTP